MGFWPFGGGKKSRISRVDEKSREAQENASEASMGRKEKVGDATLRSVSRTDSKHDGNERSWKAGRNSAAGSRTASFVPPPKAQTGRQASTLPEASERDERTVIQREEPSRPAKLRKQSALYQHDPISNTSLGPENFSVLPTLRAKRDHFDPSSPRRKSSKRKAEDYAREREIRAMSSPIPIPIPKKPHTYSGGPLNREMKQVPGDLNRRFSRPTSDVSLPLPESFSEADDLSNQHSFKIGLLAALSPRPTVRYDSNPRYAAGKRPAQSKISVQQAIQEEDPSSKRRIDDLADDLGSSDLRDLLERDKRRREKKRDSDKAKLQRRLQRRADKQKEDENRERAIDVQPSTPGRTGLGIDSDLPSSPPTIGTTVQTDSSPLPRVESGRSPATANPFADPTPKRTEETTGPIRNPFEDETDMEVDRDPFSRAEYDEPLLPVKSPLRSVQPAFMKPAPISIPSTLSPPTSPLHRPADRGSFSQTSMLAREKTPDIPEDSEIDRRASDQSGQYLSSWTTFFRKGGRRKNGSTDKGRNTPSEFSNTSRESFARQQPPPIVPPRSFRRTESGTPQRTMSKFREDLPELPISPPDSRVQSPEATTMPTSAMLPKSASRQASQSLSGTMDSRSLGTSVSIPTLDRSRQENPANQNQSVEYDTTEAGPSAAALSQSLASVDSEGSWLSGKPVKRTSGPIVSPLRQSQSSLTPHVPGEFDQGEEADDLTTDEYLNRFTSPAEESHETSASATRKASSTVIDLRNERDQSTEPEVPQIPNRADEMWHGSVGRQATVVRQASRAKSKEGLLNEFKAEASDDSSADEDASFHELETPGDEYKASPIMRATSVEYKGHARHISAGSARLLDIRRSSVQSDSQQPGDERGNRTSKGPSVLKREELAKMESDL